MDTFRQVLLMVSGFPRTINCNSSQIGALGKITRPWLPEPFRRAPSIYIELAQDGAFCFAAISTIRVSRPDFGELAKKVWFLTPVHSPNHASFSVLFWRFFTGWRWGSGNLAYCYHWVRGNCLTWLPSSCSRWTVRCRLHRSSYGQQWAKCPPLISIRSSQ